MGTDIERLLADIRSLSPQDQDRLRILLGQEVGIEDVAVSSVECADSEYQDLLVSAGLMERSKTMTRNQDAFDRFQPVEVSGKLLSESIVEERR